MAQLKDLLVLGPSRLIGDTAVNSIQVDKLTALTSSGSTSYGPGTSGQVLYTNANQVYWGSLPALPQASTLSPKMDGTAAAGSSATFARADHVHPTDTSRAASSHTHGNITNAGDITASATIANGDRLIINDESASKIINSTITFGTSTTSFLANNGTWQSLAAGQGLTLSTNTFSAVNNLVIGTQTSATNVWTGTLPTGVSDYYNGMEINYYLPKAGNSSAATLNLSSKGAKPVYNGESKNGNTTTHYPEGALLHLVYVVNSDLNSGNGCWKVSNYRNSTYYYESAYTTTGASTAAKAATCSFFTLKKCHFQLLIQNANTSATALTLNVNGTGAKAIYINGSASSTTNYTLPAGAYLVYYNGTNYYLRTDGKITGDITGSATSVPAITTATINSILAGTY